MKRGMGLIAALLLVVPAFAGVHAFPSSGSAVVGSVGFIDADQVGYFWSVNRGDSVEEAYVDSLTSVNQAILDYDVITNVLNNNAYVNWDLLINGIVVGSFTVNQGDLGTYSYDTGIFAPIPGPNYTVRIEVTNEVASGEGSHTLRYAGTAGPHSITLLPEPASLALLALGMLIRRR